MKKAYLIAGNWKMNKTVAESIDFVKELDGKIGKNGRIEVVVFPPFTSIYPLKGLSHKIKIGSQNVFCMEQGAYTGEISPPMLKELAEYVLVGHSERRHIFKESDADANRKIKMTLKHGLKPVLCVGETLEEREGGRTFPKIRGQLERGLDGLNKEETAAVVIAYEPVWAIGTGKNATPGEAQEVHRFIRQLLREKVEKPGETYILYGGSVKPGNSAEILSQPDINGVLVGGASLQVDSFSAIIDSSIKLAEK